MLRIKNNDTHVRIRDKATIKELNISKDKMQQVEQIRSLAISPKGKHERIKDLIGASLCSICGSIPSISVEYPSGTAHFRKIL